MTLEQITDALAMARLGPGSATDWRVLLLEETITLTRVEGSLVVGVSEYGGGMVGVWAMGHDGGEATVRLHGPLDEATVGRACRLADRILAGDVPGPRGTVVGHGAVLPGRAAGQVEFLSEMARALARDDLALHGRVVEARARFGWYGSATGPSTGHGDLHRVGLVALGEDGRLGRVSTLSTSWSRPSPNALAARALLPMLEGLEPGLPVLLETDAVAALAAADPDMVSTLLGTPTSGDGRLDRTFDVRWGGGQAIPGHWSGLPAVWWYPPGDQDLAALLASVPAALWVTDIGRPVATARGLVAPVTGGAYLVQGGALVGAVPQGWLHLPERGMELLGASDERAAACPSRPHDAPHGFGAAGPVCEPIVVAPAALIRGVGYF